MRSIFWIGLCLLIFFGILIPVVLTFVISSYPPTTSGASGAPMYLFILIFISAFIGIVGIIMMIYGAIVTVGDYGLEVSRNLGGIKEEKKYSL